MYGSEFTNSIQIIPAPGIEPGTSGTLAMLCYHYTTRAYAVVYVAWQVCHASTPAVKGNAASIV